jgi:7-cyano-7-deazaguanine reductase
MGLSEGALAEQARYPRLVTGYSDLHASAGLSEPLPTLEAWPSQFPDEHEIRISIPEFTSICPKTGLPDFALIEVVYVPEGRCVELKSLKEYLLGYRNLGIFNENAVNRILKDLVAVLEPRRIRVRGVFTPRGGIQTTVEASGPPAPGV